MALQPRRPVAPYEILHRSGLHLPPICYCSALLLTERMCFNATTSPSIIFPTAILYLTGSNVKQSGQENDFSRLARSNHDWSVPIKILLSLRTQHVQSPSASVNGAVHITGWVDHDLRGRESGNPDSIFGGSELKSWPGHCLS